MIFITTVGTTLVFMAYLKKKGKISINKSILYGLLAAASVQARIPQ
ncbi:hypothetical protein [Radiobacillus deserti]|nr:hypothetical protein [Radiobacillus deserti]